jgi:CRP/FNR family transcriptional regulator, cyclic AMP receptor protein
MQPELDVLRNVLIFRDLEDNELSAIWAMIQVKQVPPKTRIVEEGAPMQQLCIVTDGVVHVRRIAQKREMLLTRLGPGGFFGEVNLFDPGVATASVYAMKPTQLAILDHEPLRAYFDQNPKAGYKVVTAMMREMSRRLRQTNSRLVNSAYWSSGPAVEG